MDLHLHTLPLFLSPALPSDLLQFIINRCTYPTTLIICSNRADFLSALTQDLLQQQQQQQQQRQHQPQPRPRSTDETNDSSAQQATTDPSNQTSHTTSDPPTHPPTSTTQPYEQGRVPQPGPPPKPQSSPHPLLTPLLSQLSVTRHIRTVFIPTVSHLRAYLSVFSSHPSSCASKVVPPPPPPPPPPPMPASSHTAAAATVGDRRKGTTLPPLLVVYDFLSLHRNTSEWSVQGLGASAAVLVEVVAREGLGVVLVEQRARQQQQAGAQVGQDGDGGGGGGGVSGERRQGLRGVLRERVPVLSGGGARRAGGELSGSGWVGKTVDVEKVLGRWFQFREEEWAVDG